MATAPTFWAMGPAVSLVMAALRAAHPAHHLRLSEPPLKTGAQDVPGASAVTNSGAQSLTLAKDGPHIVAPDEVDGGYDPAVLIIAGGPSRAHNRCGLCQHFSKHRRTSQLIRRRSCSGDTTPLMGFTLRRYATNDKAGYLTAIEVMVPHNVSFI